MGITAPGHALGYIADRPAALPDAGKIHGAIRKVRRRALHPLRSSPARDRGPVRSHVDAVARGATFILERADGVV